MRNPPKRYQPPHAILLKRNRRGGACVPARTSAQRRFHAKNRFCVSRIVRGNLTMDAPLWGDTGGHTGAAPTNPIIFFHAFHTNKITIYAQSSQTKSTTHAQFPQTIPTIPRVIRPNETVGAVPVCPPEHPRSSVSIPKNIRIVCGELNDGCAFVGRHGQAHRRRPYQSPPHHAVCHYPITLYMFRYARYTSFSREVSDGKTPLFFVTLRTCLW